MKYLVTTVKKFFPMNYFIRIRIYVNVYTVVYLRLCSHSMDFKGLGFVQHNQRLSIGRSGLKRLQGVQNDLRELEVKREIRNANNRKETATV